MQCRETLFLRRIQLFVPPWQPCSPLLRLGFGLPATGRAGRHGCGFRARDADAAPSLSSPLAPGDAVSTTRGLSSCSLGTGGQSILAGQTGAHGSGTGGERRRAGAAAGHHRRQDAHPNSPDARAGASGTGVRRGLNALSKIDLFGSRRRGAKAAQAQFKASQAALDCARLGLSAKSLLGLIVGGGLARGKLAS